ncbi:MAG TPA: WbqC family protein [Candidatus Dormibacteraeota bacterium]|nr:WbqC family protein [Candidatus Dormibacteraeota bacterium]
MLVPKPASTESGQRSGGAGKAVAARIGKRVAILQSCYIPWKGYFDIMNQVDEFILYDDRQYTTNDWRNRNRIKTSQGPIWLTIPVRRNWPQRIDEARVSDPTWAKSHWRSIVQNYSRTPHFEQYRDVFERIYRGPLPEMLSQINFILLKAACDVLSIAPRFRWSTDYEAVGVSTERLVSLCQAAGATAFLAGPSARGYIRPQLFEQAGIDLEYMSYSGYPEYKQPYPPFEHNVSILDLLFCTGERAPLYMKRFPAHRNAADTEPDEGRRVAILTPTLAPASGEMIPKEAALPRASIEVLSWDSRFFKRRVGRVQGAPLTDSGLVAAIAAARDADLDCMYLTVFPSNQPMPVPERFGFHLVDVQLVLDRRVQAVPAASRPSPLVIRPGQLADIPALRTAIGALAPWSRFAMDPRFGIGAAARMYEAWLEKSAGSDRDLFAVAVRGTDPLGFIIVEGGPAPKIALIGVSEAGAGIGTLLVDRAVDWASRHGESLSVTTQARNVAALRFYGRQGFEIKSARYVYHLWLN